MSLPIVILSSIALMVDSTEATPFYIRAGAASAADSDLVGSTVHPTTTTKKAAVKAADQIGFHNAPSQPALTTTKKETTAKATTAKATTTSAKPSAASSAVPSSAVAPTTSAVVAPTTPPLMVSQPAPTNTASSAATPSSTLALSNASSSSGGGVSGGAIGGIVAAIIIIIAGIAAYFVIRRKKQQKNGMRNRAMSEKPDPFTMGFGSDQAFQQPQQQQYQHQYGVAPPVTPVTPNTYNNTYNTQTTSFHDANNHIITSESMTASQQPQYQPQLQQQQQFSQPQQQYYNEPVQQQDMLAPVPQQGLQSQPPVAVAAAIAANNTQQPKLLSPTQAGSVGVFYVAATYSPTLSDEIDIQTGDQVEVLAEYDDGWCQGINLSRGNAKGVFPKHCIDYAATSAATASASSGEVDRVKRTSSMYIANPLPL